MQLVTNKTYNFLFHPFHKEHSPTKTILSIITVIAMTAISFGIFGIIFAIVQWQDRNITIASKSPKKEVTRNLFDSTVKSASSLQKSNHAKISSSDSPKITLIKKQHASQLAKFEVWASTNSWDEIKKGHYDWWMFPVNRASAGHGATYNVSKQDIELLQDDPDFMQDYKRGVILVVKAWGWDLENDEAVQNPSSQQSWDGYGVRLAKMSDSLKLFGERALHKKLKKFFVEHCLTQQQQIAISNLSWLHKTFNS
jgi:hypothetical protein